jgi:predicted nucleic acid-binding protein
MILIDTSAWVEFLRNTSSPVCEEVDRLLSSEIAVCDPIRMEVLAGGRDDTHLHSLRRLLARATVLPTDTVDYETGAVLYRTCRQSGETVRKLTDCLIGAVALRHGTPVLHRDADFDALARHTPVQVHQPGA